MLYGAAIATEIIPSEQQTRLDPRHRSTRQCILYTTDVISDRFELLQLGIPTTSEPRQWLKDLENPWGTRLRGLCQMQVAVGAVFIDVDRCGFLR